MDPFAKTSGGSYYKVSSDLRYQSQIPDHRQINEYLQKENNIKQFELNESPLKKNNEDNLEVNKGNEIYDINNLDEQLNKIDDTNRDDSLEYRSFMPSQDFIFSHSKKNSEIKDFPRYSQDNQNSSIFKNLQDTNFSDLRAANQVKVNEFQSSNNKINENNSKQTKPLSNTGIKTYDSYGIDGKNYNNIDLTNDQQQSESIKPQSYENNYNIFDSNKGMKYDDDSYNYKFQNTKNYSDRKNSFNQETTAPTKDFSSYQRSNSDYQRPQKYTLNNQESKGFQQRSISSSKYPIHEFNSQQNTQNKRHSTDSNEINKQQQQQLSSYLPSVASFRNAAEFYSVQLPENQNGQESYYGYNSLIGNQNNKYSQSHYSADKQNDQPFDFLKKDTFSASNIQDQSKYENSFNDTPYLNNYQYNENQSKKQDLHDDSYNLLREMKQTQINHEKKLQNILRDSYDKHQRQTEEFYFRKQQKDTEIQKQYQELQKFKQQQTSHFSQNSHYDPIPDISEIQGLNHSNVSGFMNRDSYDPYTPHSSAFKNGYKHHQIKQPQDNTSFLKNNSFIQENNINSNNNSNYFSNPTQLENKQINENQKNKEQNSFILEVNESQTLQNNSNLTDFDKKITNQQKEIESLRKKIKEDEFERVTQKQLQKEQEKRIQYLEKEISNLTSRLRDAKQNSSIKNSAQSKKENLNYISETSSIQNRRNSKQDNNFSKNKSSHNFHNNINNSNIKAVQNYEFDQEKHNCGSGMKFNNEQRFRFKITELLQVDDDEQIIQKIKHLIHYKKQNESFSNCIIDTMAQLAPEGHFKNQKPTLLESWKFIKQVMQQYVNLTNEKKRLKQLAKQLSEVITKGLDSESLDLQNSIKNILIL